MPFFFRLLFSERVLLLFAPHIHHLPVLIYLHGVVHQPIHVDELDALLLGIEQHRRNDSQLSHLLLCVLERAQTQKATQSRHYAAAATRDTVRSKTSGGEIWTKTVICVLLKFTRKPNNGRLRVVDNAWGTTSAASVGGQRPAFSKRRTALCVPAWVVAMQAKSGNRIDFKTCWAASSISSYFCFINLASQNSLVVGKPLKAAKSRALHDTGFADLGHWTFPPLAIESSCWAAAALKRS